MKGQEALTELVTFDLSIDEWCLTKKSCRPEQHFLEGLVEFDRNTV
jgi:hypothetical protein